MKTFTLSQAREGVHDAVRMVSVRAAVPFLPIESMSDIYTYIAIVLVLTVILFLIRKEFRIFQKGTSGTQDELTEQRDTLQERLATRTKEYVQAESDRLAELERTVQFGELSKGLFHDLMNPLSAISLYIEKLKPEDKDHEIVAKVVAVSKRMNSFMESVRRSMQTTVRSDTPIAQLKEELGIIEDIFGYKARVSEVILDIKPVPEVRLPIHPIRLHQLFSNCVSNSIDACIEDKKNLNSNKEHRVTIESTLRESQIEIRISDNGAGMSEEKRLHLFDTPTSTKEKGLGIGLITVKKIVDELGGEIAVTSKISIGTTFTINIPRV